MMSDIESDVWLSSVVTSIQEAPISPEQWDGILVSILARTGAQVGFFLGMCNCDREKIAIVARGVPKATLLDTDIISFFDVNTQSLGQGATFEVDLRDMAARFEARSLRELFGDHALIWGVLIAREGQRRFALLLVYPNNASRRWMKHREEIMSLLPNLQVSFRTHRELVRQRELADQMEFIFSNAPAPWALVRSDLRVVLASRAFLALANENPDISVSDGELEIYNPSLCSEVHGSMDAILAGRLDHKVVWVRHGADAHGWLVSLATVTRNGHGSIPFKAVVASSERVALLCLRELGRNDSLNPDIVRAVLGLSATEASIACALADGDSSTEIAQARRVSKNTVHNQLASAMNKLGLHRQAEFQNLMSLLSFFV